MATNLPKIIESNIQAKNAHDMSASLAIEINPIDTYGSIIKKRGVVIRSSSELDEISRLLSSCRCNDGLLEVSGLFYLRISNWYQMNICS